MFKHIVFLVFLAVYVPYCHAAQQPEEKKSVVEQASVGDYTLKHAKKNIDNNVDDFGELIEDTHDNLDTLYNKAKSNPMLMCVALSNQSTLKNKPHQALGVEGQVDLTGGGKAVGGKQVVCKKYVIDATKGLLGNKAHKLAHKLGLHIVQTVPAHIIPALCQFLQISQQKQVIYLAISKPICTKCHYLLESVIGYKQPVAHQQDGCQGTAFTWPMPTMAMAYVNGRVLASSKPLEVVENVLYNLAGISTQSLQAKEQAMAALRKELAVKGNMLANRDKQVVLLKNQLEAKQEALNAKTQTIANRDSQIVLLRNQLETKQETLTATIHRLQQKEAALQKQIEEKDNFINALKKEKADVEKALKESRGLVQTILTQKKAAEQKVEEMKHEAEEKEEKIFFLEAPKQLAANETLFQQKLKDKKCKGGNWYKENIPKELAGIRKAYPLMQQKAHKQAALEVSHGLATLPEYAGKDCYVKHQYWSCKLYDLQKKVTPSAAKQLVCSLKSRLAHDAKNHCPHHGKKVSPLPAPTSTLDNPNWKARFAYAQKGWTHHDAKENVGFVIGLLGGGGRLEWYKKWIQKEMKGLQQAYPKLQAKKHKKEALELFIALSEIHRFEHFAFLFEYMKVQNRLLELTGTVGHITKNVIVYNPDISFHIASSPVGHITKNVIVYTSEKIAYELSAKGWTHN